MNRSSVPSSDVSAKVLAGTEILKRCSGEGGGGRGVEVEVGGGEG